jgi:hypothetical protein
MCWQSVEKGGVGGNYPNLADSADWFGTPLLREMRHINDKTRMRPDASLRAIKAALQHPRCLGLADEELHQIPKRHAPRHNAIDILEDGAVQPQDQKSHGKWKQDKRNMHYGRLKLARFCLSPPPSPESTPS